MEDQSRRLALSATLSSFAASRNDEDKLLRMPGPWDDSLTRGRSGMLSRTSEFSVRDITVPRTPSPGPMYYEFMGEPARFNSTSFDGVGISPRMSAVTPSSETWGSPYSFHSPFNDPYQQPGLRVDDFGQYMQPFGNYDWHSPAASFSPQAMGRTKGEEQLKANVYLPAQQPPDSLHMHDDERFLRTPGQRIPSHRVSREDQYRAPMRSSQSSALEDPRSSCTASTRRGGSFSPIPSPSQNRPKSRRSNVVDNWRRQENLGKGSKRKGKEQKLEELEPISATSSLEEFRMKGAVDIKKMCLTGPLKVLEFAHDQFGSRFLQQRIEQGPREEREAIFRCLFLDAVDLSLDVFGNYVIQKFFDFGSPSDICNLASQLFGSVRHLSLHMYGCRVIQKALEWCKLDMQQKIINELRNHVVECVEHQNGNHVIQKCIECIPQIHVSFIVREIAGSDVLALCRHCYGCRVLQRVIENCYVSDVAPIYEKVVPQWRMLASDPYGNYVIQHIMEHGRPADKHRIIDEMRTQMRRLACDKFASNVLERSLSTLPTEDRQLLTSAILMDDGNSLIELSRDRFGNYIVQRMLCICTGAELEALTAILDHRKNDLKSVAYGKHIVSALDRAQIRSDQ